MLSILEVLGTPAFLPGIGVPELLIILFIILIIFGPKKLPEMGKAIGQSIKELKKSSEAKDEAESKDEQKS